MVVIERRYPIPNRSLSQRGEPTHRNLPCSARRARARVLRMRRVSPRAVLLLRGVAAPAVGGDADGRLSVDLGARPQLPQGVFRAFPRLARALCRLAVVGRKLGRRVHRAVHVKAALVLELAVGAGRTPGSRRGARAKALVPQLLYKGVPVEEDFGAVVDDAPPGAPPSGTCTFPIDAGAKQSPWFFRGMSIGPLTGDRNHAGCERHGFFGPGAGYPVPGE